MPKLYKHPDYDRLAKKWQVYHDTFEGDEDVLRTGAYLTYHQIEKKRGGQNEGGLSDGELLRQIREELTFYSNYIEPVVSTYQSIFFKEDPDISEVKDLFGDEGIEDVDGFGKGLIAFIKEDFSIPYFLYGKPIILTDSDKFEGVTEAERKAAGVRPFWQILCPLNVMDWQQKKGQYTRFRYEYIVDEERESLEEEPKRCKYSRSLSLNGGVLEIRTYKQPVPQSGVIVQSNDWQLDPNESGTISGISELPIATLFNGKSWVKDICPLARRIYNLESKLDNILNYQGFKRTWVASNATPERWKAVGEAVLGLVPEGSALLSEEPTDTTSMENRIAKSEMALYKIAFNLSRLLPADSGSAESDKTTREKKEDIVALVVSSIKELEGVLNNAVRHYAIYKGLPEFAGRIKLSTNVTTKDVDQMLRIYMQNKSDIIRCKTWYQESLKEMARVQGLDNTETIINEIEALEPPQPLLEQRPGFGTRPPLANRLQQVANGNAQSGAAQSADK